MILVGHGWVSSVFVIVGSAWWVGRWKVAVLPEGGCAKKRSERHIYDMPRNVERLRVDLETVGWSVRVYGWVAVRLTAVTVRVVEYMVGWSGRC